MKKYIIFVNFGRDVDQMGDNKLLWNVIQFLPPTTRPNIPEDIFMFVAVINWNFTNDKMIINVQVLMNVGYVTEFWVSLV